MKLGSFFTGIGGIEIGLSKYMEPAFFCENDPDPMELLSKKFKDISNIGDITNLTDFDNVDVITAGFPCQDLSFAGKKVGINGHRSSLIEKIFKILKDRRKRPDFIIIENVPYMLSLAQGQAMSLITSRLSEMKYEWAYRIIDPRCFGIPQRRPRVVLVASNQVHPKNYLFPIENEPSAKLVDKVGLVSESSLYGFYWTEGSRGLGWVKSAVPPIKGGSTIGIPSPPAIWDPSVGSFYTPSVEDAEAIQGFRRGWTDVFSDNRASRMRWRMIGNAVCVPVFKWVGKQFFSNGAEIKTPICTSLITPPKWPKAAFSEKNKIYRVDAEWWPQKMGTYNLRKYACNPKPLSLRATTGFHSRLVKNNIVLPDGFRTSMEQYIDGYSSPT